MKNFFHTFITSNRDNNLSEQDQPESIELNEQELAIATGGCGDDHECCCHHPKRPHCDDDDGYHYDDCDYDY